VIGHQCHRGVPDAEFGASTTSGMPVMFTTCQPIVRYHRLGASRSVDPR
jgi:hypothetical protein